MGWLFNSLNSLTVKRQRKELEAFLSGLRSMSDAEIAELVVFATHTRHGLEQSGNYILDPLTLNLRKPQVLPGMIKLIQKFKSEGNEVAVASLMIWVHTIRATLSSQLLPLSRDLWSELSRGFADLGEASIAIFERTGVVIDAHDATAIPAGFAYCKCHTPPLLYLDYDSLDIGIDKVVGKWGEVSLEVCKACGAKWLRYYIEYHHITASGRWYRGIVSDEVAKSVTPENAIAILESLDWWLYGGSYFRTTGKKEYAPLRVTL